MGLSIFWWNLLKVFLYFPHFWSFNASSRSEKDSKTITFYILLSFIRSFQTTHQKQEFLSKKIFILLSQFWFLSFCKINSFWNTCIVFISYHSGSFLWYFFLWFSLWIFFFESRPSSSLKNSFWIQKVLSPEESFFDWR